MPIRVLDSDVSSKIAAGEVIERPASVVKELVENSLDAGATEISVEVLGGGTESIRVADNGAGIPADEVELAFQRYATSKVSVVQDLGSISTLGFRGEALPSIAAVSRLSLVTRPASEVGGTRVELEEGGLPSAQPQGASPGTTVTVRRLFRNFPARLKFLRTAATEVSRVQSLVTRYALAYPGVRFRLAVDDSVVFSSSGSGDLREAISDVYGPRTAGEMLELVSEREPEERRPSVATGMIGPPSLARANRSYISLFVNGRWVQSRMLGYALEQAYHGFLMERRYPMAAVNIAVPHEDVDVNVHPSKAEVKFRREGQVFSALQEAVRYTLTSHSPVPEVGAPTPSARGPSTRPPERPFWPTHFAEQRHRAAASPSVAVSSETVGPTDVSASPAHVPPLMPKEALPVLRVLGQVHNTYVAAEGPDGMYLVDQHAAHERVLFERVRAQAASGPPAVQSLLEPEVVELDARQSELVGAHRELLAQLGFQIEPFGDRTLLVRGVPALLTEHDPGKSFLDVVDLMSEGGGFETWEERAAYSVACHGAIRAGKTMSQEEMSELTRQLESCQQPHTCPHGRPTMIHMSSSHLEREFGRM